MLGWGVFLGVVCVLFVVFWGAGYFVVCFVKFLFPCVVLLNVFLFACVLCLMLWVFWGE